MPERPADEPFATPRPRYSPVRVFHAVLFVLGGGLGLLWSWPGALLISFALLAAYFVARMLVSPRSAGETRARLAQLQADLLDVGHMVEHPEAPPSADQVAKLHRLMHEFHLAPPDEDPPATDDGEARPGSS